MAEYETLARPYARAVFETARAQGALPAWSDMLALAACVVDDPQFAAFLGNPRFGAGDVARLLIEMLGERLTGDGRNLIRVLAENRRLPALPAIAKLYGHYRAEAEGTLDARLTSARPVADAERERIAAALAKRLGRRINLECRIDERLLGGAVVRAGDLVIDGSVRGKLDQLGVRLSHS